VGTPDTGSDGALCAPARTPADIAYLLRAVNTWTAAELGAGDVTGTWAGLRPLVSGARNARTADLSRRHTVITSPNGLITVTGGKLTTYRRMAAHTVDVAAQQLNHGPSRRTSATRRLPLVGARPAIRAGGAPTGAGDAGVPRVTPVVRRHLEGRYGSETPDVLALAASDPSLLTTLVPGLPYL